MRVAGLRYNLSIDTGSADFVIKGRALSGPPNQRYDNSRSRKKQFLLQYGST